MNGRHFVAGLMVAGLLATGCGGTGPEQAPANEATSQREDAVVLPCDGSETWTYVYYSDTSMTNRVGDSRCDCDATTRNWGRKTSSFTFHRAACY